MGIFDWFKKKGKPRPQQQEQTEAPNTKREPSPNESAGPPQLAPRQPYQGDLSKTNHIAHLLKVPQEERDEHWQHLLLGNLPAASFKCGIPQITQGPDGFPYFRLFLPAPNETFQCFVIEHMKDDFLLEKGLGVAINPGEDSVDWVLTYGDILNLHLNNECYTTGETPFSPALKDEVIQPNDEVITGQPSEQLLPAKARNVLSEFLKSTGIPTPKVALMVRRKRGSEQAGQDLVFNITPANYADEATYRDVMRALGWFLPRHYSFVGMDEEALGDGFAAL